MLVNGTLTPEQRKVVGELIETQGPGTRPGDGHGTRRGYANWDLRVSLTSYVGAQPEVEKTLVGNMRLGDGGFRRNAGGGSHLGRDSIAGQVRVG